MGLPARVGNQTRIDVIVRQGRRVLLLRRRGSHCCVGDAPRRQPRARWGRGLTYAITPRRSPRRSHPGLPGLNAALWQSRRSVAQSDGSRRGSHDGLRPDPRVLPSRVLRDVRRLKAAGATFSFEPASDQKEQRVIRGRLGDDAAVWSALGRLLLLDQGATFELVADRCRHQLINRRYTRSR